MSDSQQQGNEKNLPQFDTAPPTEFWTWWAAQPLENGYKSWPIKPTLVVPKDSVPIIAELEAKLDLFMSSFEPKPECAEAGFKCDFTRDGVEGCPCQMMKAADPEFEPRAIGELRGKVNDALEKATQFAAGLPDKKDIHDWVKTFCKDNNLTL
jgi:hypothetical protein